MALIDQVQRGSTRRVSKLDRKWLTRVQNDANDPVADLNVSSLQPMDLGSVMAPKILVAGINSRGCTGDDESHGLSSHLSSLAR